MSGLQKLHLEDAIEDTPQTRSLLEVFINDAQQLRTYTQGLHSACQRVMNAQTELCVATQALSQQIKVYEFESFPLEGEDSILAMTMKEFAGYFDELSSVHQVLATQLQDSMMYPIGRFLQADLDEINNMCEMMNLASTEHELSLTRYSKLGKKKDNEKLRQEASDDLFAMRRKCHQTSLHLFSALNALQYKRKTSLLDPLLGYLQAQRMAVNMANDTLQRPPTESFLSNTAASIQGVQQELSVETQRTVAEMQQIELECTGLYADPGEEVKPDTSLLQKGGYLFMRSKIALISSKWERCYFFTQAGNLMCQHKDDVAGSLVLDLNEKGTVAEPTESDDRRFCFQVISPTLKKTVVLQAENEHQMAEWIATVNNIVQHSGYVKGSINHENAGSSSSTSDAITIPKLSVSVARASAAATPSTPPSTPADGGFIPDAPIQFDLISPSDETDKPLKTGKEGPPPRINPFTQSAVGIVNDNNADNPAFYRTFEVRFLGCKEVRTDRGEALICETIRQVMATRALHNIFRTTESLLVVSSECMRIVDPSNHRVRAQFSLSDISYWAAHQENKRLFGFISRSRTSGKPTFSCHVFECNGSAEEICHGISTATKLAFQALMEKKAKEPRKSAEKETLEESKSKAEEKSESSELSAAEGGASESSELQASTEGQSESSEPQASSEGQSESSEPQLSADGS